MNSIEREKLFELKSMDHNLEVFKAKFFRFSKSYNRSEGYVGFT